MKQRKILIAGANGFLGRMLSKHFAKQGMEVFQLVRQFKTKNKYGKQLLWDGETQGHWSAMMNQVDIVINLAGKSVDCRYNQKNKAAILASRIASTKAIGEAIQKAQRKPLLWINASSATIYEHSIINDMDETYGKIGNSFSEEVCKQWEATAKAYPTEGCRQVFLRTSLVLGQSGGVFPTLKKLTKWGLGGDFGNGAQFVSFIHARDFKRIIDWIIQKDSLKGAINCTSPYPVPNRVFMRLMREALGLRFGLQAKAWMLEIGAFFMNTETELVLKSRRVIPQKLIQSGFRFLYPHAKIAIQQLAQSKP